MPSARGMRQLSKEEELAVLQDLMEVGGRNREFSKVMSILQHDPELRPLIFEHEILLKALTGITDLKAEYMLSILTAAETEMYENSRQKEDQAELTERNQKLQAERDHFIELNQASQEEITRLQTLVEQFQIDNETLKKSLDAERAKFQALEKEKECTFKNLFDEIA